MINEDFTHEPPHPWMTQALCREVDPEIHFPAKGAKDVARKARAVCGWCHVMQQCRDYALADPSITDGIWGGLSAEDRRRWRRRQQP